MKKIIKLTLVFLNICLLFLLFFTPVMFSDSIEENVSDISKELMCPVCRGQTVAESNSALANDFREIIRKKLESGESKQEIINYFINRYGESVLASPPAKGIRLIVWVAPLLAIIIGFFILARFLRSRNISIEKKDTTYEGKDEYLKKVDIEIDKE